jgi:hypothetical protein
MSVNLIRMIASVPFAWLSVKFGDVAAWVSGRDYRLSTRPLPGQEGERKP